MLHVTLIRHHMDNQRFADGYIESDLVDDIWYWDFYRAKDWDRDSKRPKPNTAPTHPFEMDEIKGDMRRNNRTVEFSITVELAETNLVGRYSLIFDSELDAKIFNGEVRGRRRVISN